MCGRLLYLLALTTFFSLVSWWQATVSSAEELAESRRSRQAVNRVQQNLQVRLQTIGCALGSHVFLRVFKQEKELEVWLYSGGKYQEFTKYGICSISGELGPKLNKGDMQAPEGFYSITPRDLNPHSQGYLSMNINYPNSFDRYQGWTGSHIMIHGGCYSTGCFTLGRLEESDIASQEKPIEELWTLLLAAMQNHQSNVMVHVFPFRMTKAAMERVQGSQWLQFWLNLKEGYDFFERERRPPRISVHSGKYIIGESGTGRKGI